MIYNYAQLDNILMETFVRNAKVIVYNVIKIELACDVKAKWFHSTEYVQN